MKKRIYNRGVNRVHDKMCCAANMNGVFEGFVKADSKEELKEKLRGSGYAKHGGLFKV